MALSRNCSIGSKSGFLQVIVPRGKLKLLKCEQVVSSRLRSMTLEILTQGIFLGIVATICMDIWAAIAKHVLGLPTADWALVGRWFGYMPKGVLFHDPIADSPAIPNELAIGWIAHYCTGIVYGVGYLIIVRTLFSADPTLLSALAFGLATLGAPWLIMQPGLGAGVFASKTQHPGVVRLVNLSMHVAFGACLYAAWFLVNRNLVGWHP